MTDQLVGFLFRVTAVLLPPVLILVVVMSTATLWMIGGLIGDAIERRRIRATWRKFLADLGRGRASADDLGLLRLSGYLARFQEASRIAGLDSAMAKKCLDDIEIDMARKLSRLTFATRVGPMLGLVGTLLPLGPALHGLASGDIETLAANLEIAFTTTVFGLLIGGVNYAAGVIRRNWYDQDVSDLEYVLNAGRSSIHSNHCNSNGILTGTPACAADDGIPTTIPTP